MEQETPVVFTNAETADKFEALTHIDQYLDMPVRKGQGTCWRGMLSDITPDAAARYVRLGGNMIQEKKKQQKQSAPPVNENEEHETPNS